MAIRACGGLLRRRVLHISPINLASLAGLTVKLWTDLKKTLGEFRPAPPTRASNHRRPVEPPKEQFNVSHYSILPLRLPQAPEFEPALRELFVFLENAVGGDAASIRLAEFSRIVETNPDIAKPLIDKELRRWRAFAATYNPASVAP